MKLLKVFVSVVVIFFAFGNSISYGGSKTLTFAWDANTEEDLDGYRLFQRTKSSSYDYANPVKDIEETETSCSIVVDIEGEYYWVARAYDTSGNESADSNEVNYRVDFTAPSAPVINLTVQ